MSPHKLIDSSWKIVTVSAPVLMHRTDEETWLLNPNRRYLLNPSQVAQIEPFIATVSAMEPGGLFQPLRAGANLTKAKVVVERLRERGIGDMLFLTGPAAFMQHTGSHSVEIDVFTLADRAPVLWNNPDVRPLCGPLEYDHLRAYNHHWFIGSVTECNEEPDQPNVYDALYAQLGFDPASIAPEWKRPRAACTQEDYRNLDQLLKLVYDAKKVDLRRVSFYVVCPFAAATVRSMSYSKWLNIIGELGKRRPVLVCGSTRVKQPETDMSAGAFIEQLSQIGGGVVNLLDMTPLRVLMALISRAKAFVGLDSGPLYIAQALRVPAVSIWGAHHPGVRLAYDKPYMDLAVWNSEACTSSPCFTYIDFPADKCPCGAAQTECEVLRSVGAADVMAKLDMVERAT